MSAGPALVLASASAARAAMLRHAGLCFAVDAAAIDEVGARTALRGDGADAALTAEALAELKASQVSARHPGAFVVGADQVLECDGAWFDKPADLAAARRDLEALRAKTHMQVSAVCVVRDGVVLWRHGERARLVMRDFSDDFLDRYLVAAGEAVLGCAGAYQLEGLGAQLFTRVEGDYFSVLGLPLLPLLDFLRGHGVVPR
ncbi:MAG: Maf family protein [Alphaproteobacteria bacterium]